MDSHHKQLEEAHKDLIRRNENMRKGICPTCEGFKKVPDLAGGPNDWLKCQDCNGDGKYNPFL